MILEIYSDLQWVGVPNIENKRKIMKKKKIGERKWSDASEDGSEMDLE